jgi:hypothetical protein
MLTEVIIFVLAAMLFQQPNPTLDRDVQVIALAGWRAARDLAPKGGAVALLGPVNDRLKALDTINATSARYAEIAIRAAVSAAQEEREELGLLLEHARSLSLQMELVGAPAQWPLPIDELAGELWLEVDRFTEAREAYERATKIAPTPNAWIGLARVSDKMGDTITACRAYGNAASTPGLPSQVELEISLYKLKCQV